MPWLQETIQSQMEEASCRQTFDSMEGWPNPSCAMPTQQEVLHRDVDVLGQQYRVVLVGFTLDAECDRLQPARQLRDFTAAAIPLARTN